MAYIQLNLLVKWVVRTQIVIYVTSWQCFIPVSGLYLDIQWFSRLSHDSFRFWYCITIVFVFFFFSVPFRPTFFLWWRDFSFNFISQRYPLFLSLLEDCLGCPFLIYSYSCIGDHSWSFFWFSNKQNYLSSYNSSSVRRVTTGYTLHWHNNHLTFEMRRRRSLKLSWIKRLEWVKKPGFHIWLDWQCCQMSQEMKSLDSYLWRIRESFYLYGTVCPYVVHVRGICV